MSPAWRNAVTILEETLFVLGFSSLASEWQCVVIIILARVVVFLVLDLGIVVCKNLRLAVAGVGGWWVGGWVVVGLLSNSRRCWTFAYLRCRFVVYPVGDQVGEPGPECPQLAPVAHLVRNLG